MGSVLAKNIDNHELIAFNASFYPLKSRLLAERVIGNAKNIHHFPNKNV